MSSPVSLRLVAVLVLPLWAGAAVGGAPVAPVADTGNSADACARRFDAPAATFDPEQAAASCREAAQHDAGAMERLGLLTLAGVGVPKDPEAAARLCAAAQARDPAVGGFCLEAAARERGPAGEAGSSTPDRTAAASDPEVAATIARLRELSNQGSRAANSELCGVYFDDRNGRFDAQRAAEWCRRAGRDGDAHALHRVGLMHLWGVGVERSGALAEAMCAEAEQRDPATPASFCVAAVREERRRAAGLAGPSASLYPQPWPAASDPEKLADAFGPDRVLETLRSTTTGLRYTCRELIRWSRYGQLLDTAAFGRPIAQYTEQDFASLAVVAANCASTIASHDRDGSERARLADFIRALPALKLRGQEIARAAQERHAETQQLDRERRDLARRVVIAVAGLSETERACVDAIQQAWVERQFAPRASMLEIRSASTSEIDGNTVVSGAASVVPLPTDPHVIANDYKCTFAAHSQKLLAKTLQPAGVESPVASGR